MDWQGLDRSYKILKDKEVVEVASAILLTYITDISVKII